MELEKRKFVKVGVLMGGPSSEREISLRSGNAVVQALRQGGHEVIPIDITTDNISENTRVLRASGIACAFLTLHGRFGEDGAIQRILEDIGIPYTGPGVAASELAMNKAASHKKFQEAGLAIPRYVVREKGDMALPGDFPLPVVVKPVSNGSSIGLSFVEDSALYAQALIHAFAFDTQVLVEEYISGRELTVGIVAEEALPVIEIVYHGKLFDYEAKYQKGMTQYVVPAALDEGTAAKVRDAGLRAHRALGCRGCSRVDIMLSNTLVPYVLEVNTIPGFTETSLLPKAARQAGMDFPALCQKLLELAYEKAKT